MNLLHPFIDVPIAHRTLHDIKKGRPENSWEGLEAAIASGFAVEIDLQLSRDGIPVVFHDYELDRLTELSGLIADLDADELENIVLIGGKRCIPRFDTFMEYVAGRVPVLVELKDQDGALGDKITALEGAACEVLRKYKGPVAVMSFNPNMIARCAILAPGIPRGLVTDAYSEINWPKVPKARRKELAAVPHYFIVGATFVSHSYSDLHSEKLIELKKSGALIFCWTIRSEEQSKQAKKIVDSVTFEGYLPNDIR